MTPERQRLAAAIERHAVATENLARVTTAQSRLDTQFFEELLPAVSVAEEALAEARDRQPAALVSAALGELMPEGPSVAEAEAALAEAERKAAGCRGARALLRDEAERAEAAVGIARFARDTALAAAVAADPARAALYDEFAICARRALRCAQALRTAGLTIGGIEAHGLRFDILEAAAAIGQQAFAHDPEWLAALAALREDPDAALPGLPDDPDAGDDRVAA